MPKAGRSILIHSSRSNGSQPPAPFLFAEAICTPFMAIRVPHSYRRQ